ncbi:MAG: MATE family efflux transporter, partial [Gammaproteobacteria bacterium]|nr:MATE family efflux transporter [Gammaproteobacteria bacterium]
LPAVWLSRQPHFFLMQVWILSVTTVTLQAITSFTLLMREFRRKLPRAGGVPAAGAAV